MHRKLKSQLEAFYGAHPPADETFARLVEAVSKAYEDSDVDVFFRVSPDLLCVCDMQLVLKKANPSWSFYLGYEEEDLLGKSLLDFIDPEDREATRLQIFSQLGTTTGLENRVTYKEEGWKRVAWTFSADFENGLLYGIGRDVTAQHQLQQDLASAQKFEAVGQLAAGLAHEINTPMQFIGDNLLFAKESFSDLSPPLVAALALANKGEASAAELSTLGELLETADFEYLQAEVPRALEDARSGINRVAELIRLVKSYSQSDRLELKEADINQSLAQTITLVGAQLTAVAEVKTLFGQLPPVVCHVASLQQAFLHLLTNAVHAIEDVGTGKGVITVETALQQGELVVSIADTGCGIAPAIRDRIFEPFFTTRAVGSGSGQGLPLVRAVVDKHRGRIDVDTEVGRGSTFRVVIPVSGA